MSETVPARPVENTLNGQVPNAQLVPITVEVPAPAAPAEPTRTRRRPAVAPHVIALIGSWWILGPLTAVMLGLDAGALFTHGVAHVMLLTASLVLLTELCASLTVSLAFGTSRSGR